MATLVEVYLRVSCTDSTGLVQNYELPTIRFTPGSGVLPVVQEVSLVGSAFTALVIPTGAKAVLLRTGTNPSLVLKSITGDQGIPITPATNILGGDQFLWLGTAPSIGILNNSVTTVVVPVVFF